MRIPEPRFICEGAEFGLHDEGCRPPEDLYYDELVEKEPKTESHGFFCQDCIETFGRKTTNKTTLKQAIREQMEEQMRKAAVETARLMHCG